MLNFEFGVTSPIRVIQFARLNRSEFWINGVPKNLRVVSSFLVTLITSVFLSSLAFADPGDACHGDLYKSKLEVTKNTQVCPGKCKMEVGHLIMKKGGGLHIPSDCAVFELLAKKASFYGNNVIGGDRKFVDPTHFKERGRGEVGADIFVLIGEASLHFDAVEDVPHYFRMALNPSKHELDYYGFFGVNALKKKSKVFFSLKTNNPYDDDFGIAIVSQGNAGAQGAKGRKGATATRKHCGTGGGSGNEAGNGGRGGKGRTGGKGGLIQITVGIDMNASTNRNKVTQYDIVGLSVGGKGGIGGSGGDGGNGIGGHKCFPVGKRSGFPPGQPGKDGEWGNRGSAGSVKLDISVASTPSANNNDGNVPNIPVVE